MTFFDNKDEETIEPTKVKIGEDEFTQGELDELVGAGRKLKQIEKEQGQPVDEILTSWGRRGNEIGDYKKKLDEYETKIKNLENPPTKEEVNAEKTKEEILAGAKALGLTTLEEVKSLVNEIYQTNRAGERIYSQVNRVLKEAKKDGKPVTSPEKLLEYMADPINPKDPERAYKLMFEKELEEWKEKRINSLKKPSMIVESKSTAGSKEFNPPKITRANISSVLRDYMSSQGEGV
jgi:hypothetical protein